jgi:hypothetical protein
MSAEKLCWDVSMNSMVDNSEMYWVTDNRPQLCRHVTETDVCESHAAAPTKDSQLVSTSYLSPESCIHY